MSVTDDSPKWMRSHFDDGQWHHRFSQSNLNTFFKCPEMLRLEYLGQMPRTESDATAIGTAFHAGIEQMLGGVALDTAIEEAHECFDTLSRLPEFQWKQVRSRATAEKYITNALLAWYEHVLPQLDVATSEVERYFEVALVADDQRTITLTGIWDYWDERTGLWDWKTANQPYEQWEINRFKIQPTAYSFGVHILLGVDAPVEFTYAVAQKGSTPKIKTHSTTRGPEHWEWLRRQAISLATLIENDVEPWPLNDQGWHCSPKWCGAWDDCKGALVEHV